ncbi:aminopeptidase P family protein [Jonesia quinghaiensis]|uniref:aminopeptidase P family protein n=1 Tax=Jonesia quinghaiensis TaxID=262806 RepID=UPI0004283E56|nr:aminopeptidase P family protein [Jonesia quinghaiensis]
MVTDNSPAQSADPAESDIKDRVNNRSHRPNSEKFKEFMTSGWAPRSDLGAVPGPFAAYTPARREAVSARFPGERLVIPAGALKVRSNDTDYRFRPHSAFAHLTGFGTDQEPDAVLVLDPQVGFDGASAGHEALLFVRPLADRDSEEFYADARYGEFWVGARPTLDDVTKVTGIRAVHIDTLSDVLAKDLGEGHVSLRIIPEVDAGVESLVEMLREQAGLAGESTADLDAELLEALSEIRLVKDEWEIAELREAVNQSIEGFHEVVRNLPRAVKHQRGERVIETVFGAHARLEGNTVGYETIAASGEHATTLHWITNDGAVRAGELVLIDAGVEVESLYTADVTRTLPVDGTFTDTQRKVYQAVLDAADAAFVAAVPGARFSDVHAAAMRVIAARLEQWGLLPVSAEESLTPEGQQHRRWMVHGTSHHLGLDVHDCAQARRDMYVDGVLEPGMVFTIEPGLYFKADDLTVPAEYRGIGVRIEDDVLVTADGNENLSAALPRTPEDVEEWMASLLS